MKEDSSEKEKQSVTYIAKLTESNVKQRLFEKEQMLNERQQLLEKQQEEIEKQQRELERQRKLEEKRRFEEEQQKLKEERQMFEEQRRKFEEQQEKHRKHRRMIAFSLIPISIGIIIFGGWVVLKKPLEKISKLPPSQSSEAISESTMEISSTTNSSMLEESSAAITETPTTTEEASIFPLSSPKRGSLNSRKTLCAEESFIVGLKTDGTIEFSAATSRSRSQDSLDRFSEELNWTDIVALETSGTGIFGIKKDGTVVTDNMSSYCVDDWNNIVSISAGQNHLVGLKSDGTVVVTRDYYNVENWSDIIMVVAGDNYIVGLKSDGTVVATGDNSSGQCNVENWSDIVSINTCYEGTIGLKSDGTVVATGNNEKRHYNDIENWTDIVKIFSDKYDSLIIGLKENGTLIAFRDGESEENSEWSDIVDIGSGDGIVALRKDGTVVIPGSDIELNWTDIVAISECESGFVGLRADGTVVSAYLRYGADETLEVDEYYYGPNVDEMKDIQLP